MDLPQTLGKYEIRGALGRGAMGVVYDGWDPLIARRVAIKSVPLPETPDAETAEEIARFRREAQAAGRLTHPNIVGVYDYGETSDVAYIVMEFVDGPTLKSLLDKRERFPLENIQRIMGDLLAGLQFSHERGVVHRDIKPANVMLTSAGQAKIADFGIARIETSSMTQAGTMLGTPAYMSPEQFRGEAADARTDVYSAGVLLYQLLTGERPFEGGLTAIMHKVLNTEPPAPSQLAGTVPPTVDAVVQKAMAKRPADRFPSAAAFAEALRAAIADPAGAARVDPLGDEDEATLVQPRGQAASAAAPSTPKPPPAVVPVKPASKLPLFAGIAAVVVILLAGAGWFLTRPAPPPPAQKTADATPPAPSAPKPAAQLQPPPAETQPAPAPAVPQAQPATPAVAPAPVPSAPAPTQPQATTTDTASAAAPATPPPPPAPAVSPTDTAGAPPPPAPPPAETKPIETRPAEPPPAAPLATTATTAPTPPPAAPAAPPPTPTPTPAQPPVAAGTPPAPTPGQPPAPEQTASIAPAALLQQISQALHGANCAVAGAAAQDGGGVAVHGLVGATTADSLHRLVAGTAGTQPVGWQVQTVDPVFCPALALLNPITPLGGGPSPGVGLALAGNRTVLQDGEAILPRLTMPGFAGELRVDYFAHDGTLAHLYPTLADRASKIAAQPARRLAPGEHLALGDPGPGKPQWQSGEPYGTDMIIAVASSVPLHVAPAQNAEDKADAYLASLASAIGQARAAGARVSGALLLVDAVPKAK